MTRRAFRPSYWGYGLTLLGTALVFGWGAVESYRLIPYRAAGNTPGLVLLAVGSTAIIILIIGLFHKASPPRLRWKILLAALASPVLILIFLMGSFQVWHICPDVIYAPGSPQAKAVEVFKQDLDRRHFSQDIRTLPIKVESAPEGWLVYAWPAYCGLFGEPAGGFLLHGPSLLLDKSTLNILEVQRHP